jgi:hypothetical protein
LGIFPLSSVPASDSPEKKNNKVNESELNEISVLSKKRKSERKKLFLIMMIL